MGCLTRWCGWQERKRMSQALQSQVDELKRSQDKLTRLVALALRARSSRKITVNPVARTEGPTGLTAFAASTSARTGQPASTTPQT